MLQIALSIFILLTATLDIAADLRGKRRWVYLLKPLTMVWVILLALLAARKATSAYGVLILIGLFFSLTGDVLLMLPRDRFLWGLAAFLLAHLAYIAAFLVEVPAMGPPLLVLPFAAILAVMMRLLWGHLGGMKIPVSLYALIILTMAWRAWVRWGISDGKGALLAALGAVLFVASDALLAYNRFAKPLRVAPLWVMSTYYAAQWLIALSV